MHPQSRSHHAATVDAFFTSGFDGLAVSRVIERTHAERQGDDVAGTASLAVVRRRFGAMMVRLGHGIAGTSVLPPVVDSLVPGKANGR